MPNLRDLTKKVTARAKAGEKAVKTASSTASRAASDAVTKTRSKASDLALQASRKLAPPTQKGKGANRALVAASALGAVGAAVIAAASVSAGRARKRTS